MKIRMFSNIITVLHILLCTCILIPEAYASDFSSLERGYAVAMPPTFHLSKRNTPEDFVVYDIASNGNKVLGIYIGNFSQHLEYPAEAVRSSISIGGFSATSVQWVNQEGTYSGDVEIQLPDAGGEFGYWPAETQFFFTNISQKQLSTVWGIINSFSKKK